MDKVRIFQRFSQRLALSAALLAGGLVSFGLTPVMAQEPATLVIHVQNVSAKGGVLRLGLYDQAHYADDDAPAVASADVPAQAGETVITLNNVAPGTYAIQTFQDLNGNGKMDTNWFGFPLEPFGFSRDARPRLSKPRFAAVKFDVAPGMNVQTLSLQDSVSLIAQK